MFILFQPPHKDVQKLVWTDVHIVGTWISFWIWTCRTTRHDQEKVNIWLHVSHDKSLASQWHWQFIKVRRHGHGKVHGPHHSDIHHGGNDLHNLDQSSSVSSFTLLYTCSSRASQFQDVQAFAVEALAVQSWPIFQEQFTDTSPQQRFKEVSTVPYLKISTFKTLNCVGGKMSEKYL